MKKQELKVAVFTSQQRDMRVIGIVLTHLKSANYTFTVAERTPSATVDVALVDDSDPEMRKRLATVLASKPSLPVVHLVSEVGLAGAQCELLSNQLMMQLLPTLERLLHSLANQPPAAPAASPTSTVTTLPPTRNRLRALVVDDSQTVRTQLANVMSNIGMACDIADGAKAALAQLANRQYDLIYVDVMMPDMDGYTLTREIKRNRNNKAPVIILTSQSSPFDRARGALAGCDIFLTKPVGLKQFYAATTKALRKSMAVDDLSDWITDPTQAKARAHA
ncbi:response regulator [Aquabacterium sp.]|uniref:response regulator n=1 Tax=Aquabacterium sp. TaxID=1872578 RepID=UPI002487A382|nr:response regulator [Aquabacterium sp.]MDI1259938.1 response regulator [Aquabacterium sp.]